jgi:hypothetical protein
MSRMPAPRAQVFESNMAHSTAWGDDTADFSLAAVWRPADWNSVREDDLVFLLPSLAGHYSGGDTADGAAGYLAKTLKARVLEAAQLMSATGYSTPAPSAAVELLVSSGILTQLAVAECLGDQVRSSAQVGVSAEVGVQHRLLADLIAIARIDRMLRDARRMLGHHLEGKSMIDWPLSFTDIIIATIHSRLNGAYVYTNHAYAHETLTVAAVIGHLVQGREAYVNRTIASCLLDVISTDDGFEGGSAWAALRHYADIGCGCEHLLALAKRVLTDNRSELAKPRTVLFSREPAHTGTDESVAQRIRGTRLLTSSMVT